MTLICAQLEKISHFGIAVNPLTGYQIRKKNHLFVRCKHFSTISTLIQFNSDVDEESSDSKTDFVDEYSQVDVGTSEKTRLSVVIIESD